MQNGTAPIHPTEDTVEKLCGDVRHELLELATHFENNADRLKYWKDRMSDDELHKLFLDTKAKAEELEELLENLYNEYQDLKGPQNDETQ